MSTLPAVVRAEYEGGFSIHLAFNDDCEATVAWPNGADIAPETLHQAAIAAQRRPVRG